MTELLLAVSVFVLSHAIPALKPVRAGLVAAVGERVYLILYSVVTVGVIVWLGLAYADAPYVEVWAYRPWTGWVPIIVMPFACILIVAGLASPNPLSISFARGAFDPARPGIVAVTRHPLMWGLALWSAAHVVPNGDAASLVLFGLLTILSLMGPPSLDRKRRSRLGEAEWQRLAAPTSNVPLAAILSGRARLSLDDIGSARIAAGLGLYAAFLVLHPVVIGVSPFP